MVNRLSCDPGRRILVEGGKRVVKRRLPSERSLSINRRTCSCPNSPTRRMERWSCRDSETTRREKPCGSPTYVGDVWRRCKADPTVNRLRSPIVGAGHRFGSIGLGNTRCGRLLAPERDLSNLMVGRNLVELAQEFAARCEDDSTAGCIEEDDSDEGDTNPSQYTQHLIYCPCRKLYTRTYR